MTKKSTEGHLKALHRAGKLYHYDRTLWPDDTCLRRLWLHPSVERWAKLSGKTAKEIGYFADVRAFFAAFVRGEDFDDNDMLKPLSGGKDGLWDLRITFHPQARVAGAFLRTGEFVGLCHAKRSDLQVTGFGKLIATVKSRWASLFPQHRPLVAPRPLLLQEFEDDI